MRGEWELNLNNGSKDLKGIGFITQEANAKEEFESSSLLIEGILPATFSGTLEGSEATVTVIIPADPPFPEGIFHGSGITVQSGPGTLSMSGTGNYDVGGDMTTGTFSAVRLRSGKQIEEQEAKEEKEREEREARSKVRGEWSLTIESGPQSVKGTALISSEANAQNDFSSSSALFESVVPGTFSGTLEGSEASVTITTMAAGSYPEGKFIGTKLALASTANPMSITGSGTLTLGGSSIPATLTATRTKTYQEVVAREKKEREAKEAQEKSEKEAQEAKEREIKEAAEKLARETKEKEAAEKLAREVKEKQELEARKAAEKAVIPPPPAPVALVSAKLTGNSFTVSASGQVSLLTDNPNDYAISGRVTLVAQAGGAAKSPSKKAASLGTASFSISASGKQVVKLELSQKGRSDLAHHKTLSVLATITTKASGQTTTTKTFSLTLHAGSAHRKG
ncbi:MAG TPA: hypothetical protein VGP18_13005 [Solirubrobacteraceae bacterium]|nr:hypothetical protein [Solirubrobacteraceae bacterium]